MRKLKLSIAVAILAALGTLVAIKSFAPATSAPTARHGAAAPVAYVMPTDMRPIVPSPVIDPHAQVFVGTGDGAAGAWVRP